MKMEKEYISAADTAKLVRKALKREFPGQKFSVRTSTYSGGASIRVGWTDGPTEKMVTPVITAYEGSDFDGMIDLKTSTEHWLLPDGTVQIARANIGHSYDHTDKRALRPEGAKLVHFMADFISGSRHLSRGTLERATEIISKRFGTPMLGIEEPEAGHAYYGDRGPTIENGYSAGDLAYHEAHQMDLYS